MQKEVYIWKKNAKELKIYERVINSIMKDFGVFL